MTIEIKKIKKNILINNLINFKLIYFLYQEFQWQA